MQTQPSETLRRLTAKCLCAVVKAKAAEFFQPHQFGVSCFIGAEKIAHGLRAFVDQHWKDEGFSVLKLDMRNVVSRQALLSTLPRTLPLDSVVLRSTSNFMAPYGNINI